MTRIPLVSQFQVELDVAERARLSRLARRVLADDPRLARYDMFGPAVEPGLGTGPSFVFEDHSEAGGFPIRHSELEYRSLLLAGTDDLVVVEGPREHAFEEYCRDVLQLGSPKVVAVASTSGAPVERLAQRCLHDPAVMRELIETARVARGLDVIPYLGGGWTWKLAAAVARESGANVRVASAPPNLVRALNDKLWFARRAAEVLGARAVPPASAAFGPAALTRRVGYLARRFDRVMIKVPTGSAALGNIVLDAEDLRPLGSARLHRRLMELLRELGWTDSYPLMVGVWLCQVIQSPSVQLWIPAAGAGPPLIEGVFDQAVREPVGAFVGAEPAALSPLMTDRLVTEAMSLAALLQEIGYFGRCSFDSVVTGMHEQNAEIHWIECNPRWTGVSIPITVANRLVGDWTRQPFVVVQREHHATAGLPFADAIRRVRDHVFTPARRSGVVVLSPEGIVRGTGFNFMAMAATVEAAHSSAETAIAVLGEIGNQSHGDGSAHRARAATSTMPAQQ